MDTIKRLGFFFLLVFLFQNAKGQHDHEPHDQNDIQRAEKLLSAFDQKFKTIVLREIISGSDYELFCTYAQDQIGRDRRLFFGKVIHHEIDELGIEPYIEKNLIRVYKNLFSDFVSKKNSFKNAKETFVSELAGDPCNNVDFEAGNTSGWQGWTGIASTNPYPPNSSMIPGFTSSQHAIVSGTIYDPIVGGTLLSQVAPGGSYSLRLENTSIGGNMARISQTFLVNPANANFTYRYAVVLEDPSSSHTDSERPFFRIRVMDQSGTEIMCGHYEVIAKPPITGFQQVGSTNYYWRDWTSVAIPLAPYVGQNVTVEFTASDCSLTGHLGYAYIDGSCFQSSITSIPSGSCGGLPYTLIAPAGYASYAWTGPGIVGANNVQTITVNQTGTYTCVITSVSGPTCKATLKAIVGATSTVNAGPDFNICAGGYAQLNASISLTNSFSWSPTTGLTNPNTLNPIARPTTTTTYYLTACGLTDSVTVYVDPVDFAISPSITTCGSTPVVLSATPSVAGSYSYSWTPTTNMTGSATATPTVTPTSTTTYSVTVTNLNTGCTNTKQVTVTVAAGGGSTSAGADKTYCGTPVQLNATGGSSFTWTDINGNAPTGLSCTNCSNPLASPATTTSYIVISNLTAPCVNKDTVTVFASSPFTLSLPSNYAICGSGNVTLTVTPSIAGSYTYNWQPSASLTVGTTANPIASPASNTNYSVTVTDAVGCSQTAYTLVNKVNLTLTNTAAPSNICQAGTNSTLTASITSSTCNNYTINSIGYAPVSGTGTTIGLANNVLSSALPIGFNFGFYCNNYSQFYVSDNGFITFTNTSGAGCCSGAIIPSLTIPNNLIAAAWGDLNPILGGNVNYFTTGTAPNRRLVVNYTNVPHSSGVDSVTAQIVLYETSNAIAIHLTSVKGNGSNHTMGIENNTGTLALSAPGKNGRPWTSTNESYLFSATPTITWFEGATNIGTGNSINVVSNATTTYTATAGYSGCSASAPVTVTLTTISAGNDVSICLRDSATLNATSNMATAPSYTWTPSTGLSNSASASPKASPSVNTSYIVSASNGSCIMRDTVEVVINVSPTVNIGNDTTLCVGSSLTLNAGNVGATYLWSTGAVSQIITVNTPGIYWVEVDNGLCKKRDSITIIYKTVPIVNLGLDKILCTGSSTTLNAGNAGSAYSWSTGATSQTISASAVGYYWVDVNNGACPVVRDSIYIDNINTPVVNLGPNTTLCTGTPLLLNAGNAGSTYNWSTGATSQTLNVVAGGIYWVDVNNGSCPTVRDSITVTYKTVPIVNLGLDKILCTGSSTTLNAGNAGSAYSWSTGATSQTISASAAGYYWVDVNNGACPIVRDSIYIDNINTPVVNLGPDATLCTGTPLLLNAGNAGSTYNWSTGATSQTLSVVAGGIYWVDVNNGSCPTVRDSITVTYKTVPIVNLGLDKILCTGSSTTLNAGNTGSAYSWSTGATSQTISASAVGYYWVDVNNGACPVVRDSIYIDNINTPVVNLGPNTTLCTGTPLLLNAGNAGSTYNWSTGATSQTLNVVAGGIYWVDVNNGSCPTVRDSITVTYKPVPVVNLGLDTSLCTGQQITLNAGNAGSTYGWSTGSTAQTLTAGTQGYYWVDVNNGTCPTVRDSIYLTILVYPAVNLGPDRTQCIASTVSLDAANVGYPKVWSTGATTSVITPSTTGIYWVDVKNNQCITRDSVSVTYVPVATVDFGNDTTVCNGTNVVLTVVDPGVSYQWSTGASSQSITVNNAGSYYVDVDNGYCTVIRYTIDVIYVNPPVVDLGIDSVNVCYNDNIILNAGNTGSTFIWYNVVNPAISTAQQIQLSNATTGYYWVDVNNGTCIRKDSVYIRFTTYPDPLRDTTVCFEQQIIFSAGAGYQSYLWQDSSSAMTYTAAILDLISDTIKVRIEDQFGCVYIDSMILVAIDCREEELFIPNLITPNNDYQNDQFHVKGLPDNSEVYIHNRWGDLIYKSSDYDNKWGGDGVSDGVYYYLLKFKDGREFKGWLQIIH